MTYLIDGGVPGRERLRLLSNAMRPLTESFLDRLDIQSGMRCLDAGCGGGDVTHLLAKRCSPSGHVVGIDSDPDVITIAQRENDFIAQHENESIASSIDYVVGDVTSFHPEKPFDAIYTRFLLSHLTDAAATLRHLRSMLRPSGIIAIEDVWFPGHFCYPESDAFTTFVRWYREVALARGADPDLGLKLPSLLHDIGFNSIEHEMRTQAYGSGPNKHVTLVTLERIQKAIVESSVATIVEVTTVVKNLKAFIDSKGTIVSMAPVMQISARV